MNLMENYGKNWTVDEKNKMLALLAQTRMSSMDCDIMFSNMLGRTTQAFFMQSNFLHKILVCFFISFVIIVINDIFKLLKFNVSPILKAVTFTNRF